jgi:hypothetical protein
LWYQHDRRHSTRLLADGCVYPGVDFGVGRVKERHSARISPAALESISFHTDKVRKSALSLLQATSTSNVMPMITLDGDKQPLRCAPKVAKRGITLSLFDFFGCDHFSLIGNTYLFFHLIQRIANKEERARIATGALWRVFCWI